MQTFLPYSDPSEVARVLDYRRLGKQRVEAYQILRILTGKAKSHAWKNHPAVLMWEGYETQLAQYGWAMCNEWIKRGYKDNLSGYFKEIAYPLFIYTPPEWITEELMISHRSNLIRKDPEYYSKFWPNLRNDMPYIWPTKLGA